MKARTGKSASTFTSADPWERAVFRRGVEAINWGMPAVNLDLMREAGVRAGAKPNQIVYWSGLPDWKIQTLTPNPDVIYFGPKAPAGKESNWTPTSPEGKFEILFRAYGPEKTFFDKKWVLPDIEKID